MTPADPWEQRAGPLTSASQCASYDNAPEEAGLLAVVDHGPVVLLHGGVVDLRVGLEQRRGAGTGAAPGLVLSLPLLHERRVQRRELDGHDDEQLPDDAEEREDPREPRAHV